MAGTEWVFTRLGVHFFEGTLPSLVRAVENLTVELKRMNDLKEKERSTPKAGGDQG